MLDSLLQFSSPFMYFLGTQSKMADDMTTTDFPEDQFNKTLSDFLNHTEGRESQELLRRYVDNWAIDYPADIILIITYCVLISVGAMGNILLIVSVVRKPAMRTPRNMFIVNLAVSDLLLCTVTMPLTLREILAKHFPYGNNIFICKIIGMLQAVSIYVSTISITAIALDRYQVIVYPTKESLQLYGAVGILGIIWLIAVMLAAPLYMARHLVHNELNLTNVSLSINYCIENWPIPHGRAVYSTFSLVFQYILPFVIVSAAYVRISYKLRCRFAAGFVSNEERSQNSRRAQLRGRRLQKTNALLASIAAIFCISWMPLNLFNLIADYSMDHHPLTQGMLVGYAVCHMMGMSSACSNPVLYGCLNDNFWKEFVDMLCHAPRMGEHRIECKRLSVKKTSKRVFENGKGELLTATTDFNQGTTVNTETSFLTKC